MQTNRGFTLIELLITLVVAAILISIAVPSFKTTIENDRMVSQANTLLTALVLARSDAIKIGGTGTATICPSPGNPNDSGYNSQVSCSGSNWATGWIVYDTVNGTNTILRKFPDLSGNNTLSSTGGASFTFLPSGLVQNSVASTFTICDDRGAHFGRVVYLDFTGRAEAGQNPGQGINGSALTAC